MGSEEKIQKTPIYKPIKEGFTKKGGVNDSPPPPRPNFQPVGHKPPLIQKKGC